MTDQWNATDMKFTDISSEASREYVFADGSTVPVEKATHLHVSASGGHRLRTVTGQGVYIPAGFVAVRWTPRDGQPTFVL